MLPRFDRTQTGGFRKTISFLACAPRMRACTFAQVRVFLSVSERKIRMRGNEGTEFVFDFVFMYAQGKLAATEEELRTVKTQMAELQVLCDFC